MSGEVEDFPDVSRLGRLSTVEVLQPNKLADFAMLRSLILVGGTCAGKSTLAYAAVTEPKVATRCDVVQRYTTRVSRRGDAAEDLVSIPWPKYFEMIQQELFALSWIRPMPDGQPIGYGCLPPRPGRLPIFMAGHGIYTNRDSVRPPDVLSRSLIVGIHAPQAVRATRLSLRSPDVVERGPAAVESLLSHDDEKMAHNVDVIVHNYGPRERQSPPDFIELVKLLTSANQKDVSEE